jgi:hypothetical protein
VDNLSVDGILCENKEVKVNNVLTFLPSAKSYKVSDLLGDNLNLVYPSAKRLGSSLEQLMPGPVIVEAVSLTKMVAATNTLLLITAVTPCLC